MNFSTLLFSGFSFKIFAFFTAAAFGLVAWRFYTRLKQKNLDTNFFVHHFWRWVLTGLLVGRLLAFFITPEILLRQGLWGFFMFWDGGVHPLGVLLGGGLALFFDTRYHGINSLRWLDLTLPAFFLALIVLDIGAFLTGAWYGRPTSLFFGITYNTFGVEYVTPVHPVTLYALLLHGLLLFWANKRRNAWEATFGKLFSYGVGLWALAEAFLQFFRGDKTLYLFSVVRFEQILFILLSLGAFFMAKWLYGAKNPSQ